MESKVFTKSENFKSEYSCAVVKIGELTPVEGSDFLSKTNVFGTQIVVRKDQVKEGDVMLYAANETQLNEKFLSSNNLYEISCREKNANAEEVAAIMKEYEPIKAKADKLRNEAKNIKASMEQMTKRASKLNKQIKKKIDDLEKIRAKDKEEGKEQENEEAYGLKQIEINDLQKQADECTKRALEKTTVYTNLKKEVEDTIKSGEHIVAEAKKHVGFFNKYGRVRCIVLKGCPSFGFLFGANELKKYDPNITDEDISSYIGEEFDTVNGELFVKAFVPPLPKVNERRSNSNRAQKKVNKFDRMIEGEFYFHYDTSQLQKCIQYIKPDDVVTISVKKHGTSSIIGKLHVKEKIKLPFPKNVWNWFIDKTGLFKGLRLIDYVVQYGPIYTSRTVIKNRYINDTVQEGYYSKDIWTEYGDIIYPYLEEGMTVYGEICGYVTGTESAIQKFYDYGCNKGENNIMFYRITTTKEDGSKREWEVMEVYDWTKKLIERMQEANDENWKRVKPIDILYHGTLADLYPEIDTENHWHENVLEAMKNDKVHFGMEDDEPLCRYNKVPREGVCLRKFNDTILECFKLKTNSFLLGEVIRMDEGDVDIEMAEGYGDQTVSEEA